MQQEFKWATQQGRTGDSQQLPLADLLLRAINDGDCATVKAVLSEDFDLLNYFVKGKSLLRIAGEIGRRAICELLVSRGADPNESHGKLNYALLHNAAASGNFGFTSILLDLGAAPSPVTSSNATPLHFAARKGYAYLARKLIEFGADVNAQDGKGRTPLLLAFRSANKSVAELLMKNKADTSCLDTAGSASRTLNNQVGLFDIAASFDP